MASRCDASVTYKLFKVGFIIVPILLTKREKLSEPTENTADKWQIWNLSSACCCCWVTSVMSNSVWPQRQQPTGLPRPWDSPGKNTGVGCHFLLQCMKVKSESEVAQSCPTLAPPWIAAYQAPPSMGFSRQKYWSGVPLPNHGPFPGSAES